MLNIRQCIVAAVAAASIFSSAQAAKYDVVSSTRAMVAREALQGIDFSGLDTAPGASTEMYSPDKMNSIIENNNLVKIVRNQDRCQVGCPTPSHVLVVAGMLPEAVVSSI